MLTAQPMGGKKRLKLLDPGSRLLRDTPTRCMCVSTRVEIEIEHQQSTLSLHQLCTVNSSPHTAPLTSAHIHRLMTSAIAITFLIRNNIRQAAQDLLAGISMSQLFSQPSSPAQTSRYREYAQPSPHKFPSPARPAAPETSAMGKKTPKKWWERQTTTEIEITGTVNDVINPSLLAAGKAEVGEKAVAVASLRELWDEERARSRAAGGGSQLSAPPGLELADSQDAWEPPEGLLTQDMRGAVNDLARSVVEKNPSAVSAASPWQSMSHICSSQARTSEQRGSRQEVSGSSHVELTPSRDGPLSQASIGSVATVSASPANYLIAPDAQDLDDDTDTHEGLLDMLAALRGSQGQSQRSPGGGSSRCSPTMTRHGTQLLHEQASQDPNPVSFEGHAEAITATQVKLHECQKQGSVESQTLVIIFVSYGESQIYARHPQQGSGARARSLTSMTGIPSSPPAAGW